MSEHEHGASPMDEHEARELLSTAVVGRVAFVVEGRLELLPVNVAVRDGILYFRTSGSSVLARLVEPTDVVVEVDHLDDLLQLGWSVLVRGSTSSVDDERLRDSLSAAERPRPWADGERDLFVAVTPTSVTGRRVRRPH